MQVTAQKRGLVCTCDRGIVGSDFGVLNCWGALSFLHPWHSTSDTWVSLSRARQTALPPRFYETTWASDAGLGFRSPVNKRGNSMQFKTHRELSGSFGGRSSRHPVR